VADTKEREASKKFRATGDREYMEDFASGRQVDNCESCGYSLRRPKDHGTNEDGSSSGVYCLVCFKDGAFVHEATDSVDFLEKAAADLAEFRSSSVGRIKLTMKKELKRLPRWSGA